MAKAVARTVTKKSYTLELSEEEAMVLRALFSKVGGDFGEGTPRSAMHDVSVALDEAGVTFSTVVYLVQAASGNIQLGDRF